MKASLSSAFSTKALREQEDIVTQVVDNFVKKVANGYSDVSEDQSLNMTKWYEMISFDILGEMAFGESFHCIENGMLGL